MKLKAKADVQLAAHKEAVLKAYSGMGLPVSGEELAVSKGKLLLFNRYEVLDYKEPALLKDSIGGMERTYAPLVPEMAEASVKRRMRAAEDALKAAGVSAGPVNLWRAVQLQAHGIEVNEGNVKGCKGLVEKAEKREDVEFAEFLWNLPAHAMGGLRRRLRERVIADFIEASRKKGIDPVEEYELARENYKFVLNARGLEAWKQSLKAPTMLSPTSAFLGLSSLGVKAVYQVKMKLVGMWVEDKVSYSENIHTEEVQRTEMIQHPTTEEKVTASFGYAEPGHRIDKEVTVTVRNSYDLPDLDGNIKKILFIEKSSFKELPPDMVKYSLNPDACTGAYYDPTNGNINSLDPIVKISDGPDGPSYALLVTDGHNVMRANAPLPDGTPVSHEWLIYYRNDDPTVPPVLPQGQIFAAEPATVPHTYTEQVTVYSPIEEHHQRIEHPSYKTSFERSEKWFVEHWDRLVAAFVIPLAVLGITTGYRKWNAFARRYAESDEFREDFAARAAAQIEAF